MPTVTQLHPEKRETPRRRVLVVEDNLDIVHSTALLLRAMGQIVEFAINGLAALEIARSFRPDFILMDINLPDVRGDKLIKQLKFEPGLEHTRIIAITGLPLEEITDGLKAAGCRAVYAKPLAPSLLEELLAEEPRKGPGA